MLPSQRSDLENEYEQLIEISKTRLLTDEEQVDIDKLLIDLLEEDDRD